MSKEYIDKEAAKRAFFKGNEFVYYGKDVHDRLDELPAADVREVVLCGECFLHTHCRTEDVFDFAGLREENRFCSAGNLFRWKRKTNNAKTEVQDG